MKRLKKGFSLAEGVIALAVIAIVSVAVTALCIYGARTTPKLYAKFQASNIAADVVTCFDKACEDATSSGILSASYADTALAKYLNFYVYGDSSLTTISGSESSGIYTYTRFIIENVSADVTANFSSKTVSITTYYGSSTDVLYSYSKGDAS